MNPNIVKNCVDCGADIRHRYKTSIRCKECAPKRGKGIGFKRVENCTNCGTSIVHMSHLAKMCARCKSGKEAIVCLDCGIDISEKRSDARRCKPCQKAWTRLLCAPRNKAYREEHKVRLADLRKVRVRTFRDENLKEGWLRGAMNGAHARAQAKQIPFERHMVKMPDRCPVFSEIELDYGRKTKCGDSSPSLDRIVPERGYVPDNVRVVSFLANRLRSNVTDPEVFMQIYRWLKGDSP